MWNLHVEKKADISPLISNSELEHSNIKYFAQLQLPNLSLNIGRLFLQEKSHPLKIIIYPPGRKPVLSEAKGVSSLLQSELQ